MSAHEDSSGIEDNGNGILSHEPGLDGWLFKELRSSDQARFFTVGVNHCALNAWLSQNSPCCAAAVIAQAMNCCYPGRSPWRVEDGIDALICLVESKISTLVDTLVSLGATCDVKALLESRLDEEAPGWKKSKKVKKSAINKVVNKLAEEIEENSRKGISADDDSADDAGGVQCDELPSSVAFDIPFGPSSEREPVARALQGLAMKMDCLQRLQRARPSTAGIGNWAIEDVLRHHRLDVRTVLGRAVLGERKPLISTTDKRAWDKFKGEFTKHDCMIIHVNNHYAMVFAYRERDNLKEVLTAKKGQKPKYWVDWTHVIAALNKWQGYGVSGINKMDTAEGQHLESKQGGTFEDSNFNQT